MFKKISRYFQDPEYPTLGPVVQFFKLTFIWAPSRTKFESVVYHSVLVFAIATSLNQLAYMIIMRDPQKFISLVQYSTYHIGVVKIFTYHIWHEKWETIIDKLSKVEKELETDKNCKDLLNNYKNRGRKLILAFWAVAVSANIVFFLKTWFSTVLEMMYNVPMPMRTKIFYIWWPFNEVEILGWTADMFLQNTYAYICTVHIMAWDSLLVLTMVVFAGLMQLVTMKFKHSFDSGTLEEQKRSMIRCHEIYVTVLQVHEVCNSVLSPPLFVHLLIVSMNMAVSISYLNSDDPALFATALIFMGGILIQLVLYYWHGNEITVQSELVSYRVFESKWVDKSLDIRRLIALLSASTTKLLYFSAGPFSRISLSTFVAILRASYSFYTLMKETGGK